MSDIDNRRRRILKAAATGSIVGLAGCSGDGGQTATSGDGGGSTTESGGDTESTDSGGDASESQGGNLTVALQESIVALDFTLAYDFTTNNVTNPLWDTLLEYTFDDVPKVQKGLAADVSNPDATTYEYTLKDATFHNGDPVTAADVKASYDRVRNPEMTSPLAWALGNLKEGDEGIEAVDEKTVRFNLKSESAVWQYMPTFVGIGPKKAMEEHGKKFGREPGTVVGSGPLQIESWNQGSTIELSRFEDHRKADMVSHDTFTFKVVPEGSSRVTGLKTGELDIVIDVPPQQWSQVSNQSNAEMKSGATYLDYKLAFQNEKEPWKSDKKLRKAFAYATNWKQIIKTVYFDHGVYEKGPLPQNMRWHNDEIQPYGHDPEKAKQLYDQSGGIDRPIKFIASNGASARVATVCQNQWSETLGVEVNVQKMPYEQLLPLVEEGDYDVLNSAWGTDYPDPDGMLYAQYHSDNHPPANNESWYTNEEVDSLLTEARQTTDEAVREENYKKAQKLIHEDSPAIWGMLVEKGFGVRTDANVPKVTPMWYWQDMVSGAEGSN
jgi:peptide/nickel transport system substrate-binding protein